MRDKKNALDISKESGALSYPDTMHLIARTRQVLSGYPISKLSYPGAAVHMPTTA